MNYTILRSEGANALGISTRTIDRYIRSRKIRSQKRGKNIYLNDQDVEILKNGGIQENYEVIGNVRSDDLSYKNLYEDLKKEMLSKDDTIKDLSYKLGKTENELVNSISMLEYKKVSFLLESSKTRVDEEKKELTNTVSELKETLKKEKMGNMIVMICLITTLIIAFCVWIVKL